jgi:hypothetical protein
MTQAWSFSVPQTVKKTLVERRVLFNVWTAAA